MDKKSMVVVPGKLLDAMYILEDEIPRDGGRWPEYARTMMICIDSVENGLLSGRINSYFFREAKEFLNLDQMIQNLEELLDRIGQLPKHAYPWKKNLLYPIDCKTCVRPEKTKKACDPPPAYREGGLKVEAGAVMSFYLRVFNRRNCSLQGIVMLSGAPAKPVSFRSGMELMSLLRCWAADKIAWIEETERGSTSL